MMSCSQKNENPIYVFCLSLIKCTLVTRNQQQQQQNSCFLNVCILGKEKQWSEVLMERFVTLKMKEQNPAIKCELEASHFGLFPSSDLL